MIEVYVAPSSFRLGLNTMTLQVKSENVNSGQGVSISVTGIAQVDNLAQWGSGTKTEGYFLANKRGHLAGE